MIEKPCEQQQKLSDVFYGEAEMTDALRKHLDHCQSCQIHWEGILHMQSALEAELDHMTGDTQPDMTLIRSAFRQADQLIEKRQSQSQFRLFVLIALGIIGLMTSLITTGNATILIYEQIIVTCLAIVSMPFVIRHRLKRGW